MYTLTAVSKTVSIQRFLFLNDQLMSIGKYMCFCNFFFFLQSEILDVALVNHSNAQPEPIFTRRQKPDANVRF